MHSDALSPELNWNVATDDRGELHVAASIQSGTMFRDPETQRQRTVLRDVNRVQVTCPTCKVRDFCLSEGLDAESLRQIDQFVSSRNRVRKGETLFRIGDHFSTLYAIRSGSCKTVSLSQDGYDQVSGYHISGEIIGTDGIGTDRHGCQAVALEDTEVCGLPFDRIEALSRKNIAFQHNFHRLLSREISRERTLMMLLGTMHAEQRMAAFLLELSQRYDARGYSPSEFVLRMTRRDIGSYLGLKLETVSRLFSRFHREGLIHIQGRGVKLLDRPSLMRLIDCSN
jgi:CRP/FNR family transcriptional regulator, anaerobic regulatory protein